MKGDKKGKEKGNEVRNMRKTKLPASFLIVDEWKGDSSKYPLLCVKNENVRGERFNK